MHVMTALPPSNGKPAAEITNKDTNQRVHNKIVRYAAVSCVVRSEHNLLPEDSERSPREHIPLAVKAEEEKTKQYTVAHNLLDVFADAAVVEPLVVNALM